MNGALEELTAGFPLADRAAFLRFCREFYLRLEEANRRFNLTRLTTPEEYAIKHVVDSLALLREVPAVLSGSGMEIADVGCGAGFPSAILAAARPELRITAIDSTGKKSAFLREAAAALGLGNLAVVNGRANELARRPEFRRRFDAVTARAVAPAPKLRRECATLLKPGSGFFALYQTPAQSARELPELAEDPQYVWSVTPAFELPEQCGARDFLLGLPRRRGGASTPFLPGSRRLR